ncbi:MAG: TIGR02449 family protein [Methylococcales bacterium]|nr:TIGR02449 family protein [Methylococcales bacterium]MBT7409209.1 TIGR02449 family protein [Methylococcales bacterium]
MKSLESKTLELINACQKLSEENDSLRQRQSILVAERTNLVQKNELARERVESMIVRLKEMEENS